MTGVRIAIVGGGSTYTPDLIDGIIRRRETLTVERLTMMDIDPERQATVAAMGDRMLRHAGLKTRVETTTDMAKALSGADFVLGQIRVGRMAARVRDERLSLRLGLIGQETTGLGGFANAFRTIPPTLAIAETIARVAPNAWYINFSNPSGIVTEAVLKHAPAVRTVGICDVPVTLQHMVASALGADTSRVRTEYFGLNHLGWVCNAWLDGRPVWDQIFDDTATFSLLMSALNARIHYRKFDDDLVRRLRLLPSIYLAYFYYPDDMLAGLQAASELRGEQVQRIEEELLRAYADSSVVEKPTAMGKRRATFYSEGALDVLSAIANNRSARIAVITRNGEAMAELPPEVAIERDCDIDGQGPRPVPLARMPVAVRGLVQAIKAYEELTVEAAVTGNRDAAVEALMINPLVGTYPSAVTALDAVLDEFRDLLPPIWQGVATTAAPVASPASWPYEVAVLDLDGTVLDTRRRLSPKVRTEIKRVSSHGVRVVLATGRPFVATEPLARQLGLRLPAILENGAMVVDLVTGECLECRPMDADTLQLVLAAIEPLPRHFVTVSTLDGLLMEGDPDYMERAVFGTTAPPGARYVHEFAEFRVEAATKVWLCAPTESVDRFMEALGQDPSVSLARTLNDSVDATAAGVSKFDALSQLLAAWHVESSGVMAIGDSVNDLDLLTQVGLGIAMGNASDSVKAAAKAVTDDNDHGGVATALREVFPPDRGPAGAR